MTLGIVVFGAAFLAGLGLGTYTRRPLSTAFLVLGSFTALLVLTATGEVLDAAAVLAIVALLGLVAESMRETVLATRRRLLTAEAYPSRRAGVAELANAAGLGPVGPQGPWRFESSRPHWSVAQKRSRRNSPMSWRVVPSIARSARISPTTEQNL